MKVYTCAFAAVLLTFACAKSEFSSESDRKAGTPGSLDQQRQDDDDDDDRNDGGNTTGGSAGDTGDKGDNGEGNSGGSDSDKDTDVGESDSNGSDGGDIEFSDGDRVHTPKPCEAEDIKVIKVGEKCPRNMALYTMDDMGSKASVPGSYVCCSLPAGDILMRGKKESYIERSRVCNSDEVMVGAVDNNGSIFCTKINTEEYALSNEAKMVCAGEKGSVFGIGAKDCDGSREFIDKNSLPSLIKQLVIGPLGSDGCVSMPYGSLVTKQGGHKCEDSAAMTLKRKATGKYIKIFP